MDVRAIFGLTILCGFVASGMFAHYFAWPRLRELPRGRALQILAAPQLLRFVGLSFLIDGVVGSNLPDGFAVPAAYGDLFAMVLAMVAIIAIDTSGRRGRPLVWLMNAWGTADLLFALYSGARLGVGPSMLGAAYYIPTVLMPVLLTAHVMSFQMLLFGRAAVHHAAPQAG